MEKSAFFNSKLLPYLLLVPQLIITFVFFYWPASQAVWQSFLREDAFGLSSEFIGLENYQALFAQPEYYKAMLTTLVFSTLVAALSLSIALLFATQADKNLKAAPVYKTFMIWPYAVRTGGGRRAVVLHVPSIARHPGAAAALDGLRLESAAERQPRHDPGGDGRGVEADLL